MTPTIETVGYSDDSADGAAKRSVAEQWRQHPRSFSEISNLQAPEAIEAEGQDRLHHMQVSLDHSVLSTKQVFLNAPLASACFEGASFGARHEEMQPYCQGRDSFARLLKLAQGLELILEAGVRIDRNVIVQDTTD